MFVSKWSENVQKTCSKVAFREKQFIVIYGNLKLLLWKITKPADKKCELFHHSFVLLQFFILSISEMKTSARYFSGENNFLFSRVFIYYDSLGVLFATIFSKKTHIYPSFNWKTSSERDTARATCY